MRAMRGDESGRSFHIAEAPPESTSHGMDLYGRIMGGPDPAVNPGGTMTSTTTDPEGDGNR